MILLAALLAACAAHAGENITVTDGTTRLSGAGGNPPTDEDSTISGTNSTYRVQAGATVVNATNGPNGYLVSITSGGVLDILGTFENWGAVEVTGGKISISGSGELQQENILNVNTGGIIDMGGDTLAFGGVTTFNEGSQLNITAGDVAISQELIFLAGSSYTKTGGIFRNVADLRVDTRATGAGNIIADVVMSGPLANMHIEGKAESIGGIIANNSNSIDATIHIQTDAGGSYSSVNVNNQNLIVYNSTEFTGNVLAGTFTVNGGTSTVTGSSAHLNVGSTGNTGNVTVNSGATLKFENGGRVSSTGTITVKEEGKLHYYGNADGGMQGLTDAFSKTVLETKSDLYIDGTGHIAGALTLHTSAAASRVTVTEGLTFNQTVNVKDADLIIKGTANETYFKNSVTAANITVDDSKETIFENAIILPTSGRLTVKSTATMTGGSATLAQGNVQIDQTGTLNNYSSNSATGLTIAANNTFTNEGTFNNGTPNASGATTGYFKNLTTTPGAITNKSTGTMVFGSGTRYTASGGYNGKIRNEGTVEANVQMGRNHLNPLMRDMDLIADSEFTFYTEGNYTLESQDFTFGSAVAGSNVNIKGGSYSITFGNNSSLDVKSATLNIQEGKTLLTNHTGGPTLITTEDIVIHDKGILGFATGTNQQASTRSKNFTINSGGKIEVSESNHLTINTTGGTGSLTGNGSSIIDIAKNGKLTVDGSATINSGGKVTLGETAEMRVSKDIVFADNTTIGITVQGDTISKIISTTGDITVSSAGTTEVIFSGSTDQIVGQIFMHAEDGTVTNYQKLYNTLYIFGLDTSKGGEGVVVTGIKSVVDIMKDKFGEDMMSINKYNGGNNTDAVLQTDWGRDNADLATYIQLAAADKLSATDSFNAFGQLYGEYGAYAANSLMSANDNFTDMLYRRMNRFRSLANDCNVCEVQRDPCDRHSTIVVSTSNPAMAMGGRGGFWGGAFGDWSRQKGDKNINGYDYSAGGAVLGYDYANECLAIGFAAAYTNGTLKVDKLGTKFDSDIANVGLYAAYNHESNVYLRGHLSYGYGWNDYEVDMILGGQKEGDYKNQSYAAGLEIGYRAELPCDFSLVPSVGVEYTHVSQQKWTETVRPAGDVPILANHFDRDRFNSVEIPIGVRLAKVINMGDMVVIPEVRGAFIYQANDRRDRIRTGYAGSGMSTTMWGTDCGPTRGMVGGGVRAIFSDCFDMSIDYTLNFKGGYRDHNLTGTLGLSF